MTKPADDWFDKLPQDRLIAEFSVWSADLVRLADDMERIGPHADILHIDVADGHFSPAFLFFPDLVARIRDVSGVPIHVHLMVSDRVVIQQIRQFAEAGADLISIHVENGTFASEALTLISELGLKAGMVLQVETPVQQVAPYIDKLDFLTLLGTAIGVKGQSLDPTAPARLTEARMLIASAGRTGKTRLAADGAIREHTVPMLREAGAETCVLGSLAFGAQNLGERMAWFKSF